MTNAATKNNKEAINIVKARFVRLPSNTSSGRFRDIETGIAQSDACILRDYYCRSGGNEDLDPAYLLGCLDWAYGERFVPNAPMILGNGFINLWRAPDLQPSGATVSKEEVGPFIEFLKRWFPDDNERDYFGWWIAMSVRHQDQKIIATPLLRSEHGVGKGFMAETFIPGLLGKSSAALCHLKDVVGDFNETVEGKTCLVIDEVYRSKKSTTDSLKSIQGNATLTLRRKHQPVVVIDNYINFIITSNDHIPLVIENNDRRFWIPAFIRHKENKSETDRFLNDKFKPWLVNGGFQLVRDYLEQVDLGKYRATGEAPMTDSKLDLLGFTTTDKLEDVLASVVRANQVLTVQALKNGFADNFEHGLTDVAVANALLGMGCVSKRSNTQRFYITPSGLHAGLSTKTPPKELEKLISTVDF
ncbi:primase-helicase family protein [Pseudomonas juntendi]|uniref:primase-helicase family protein n=1 Tax=Pseudomonas juntendi TaxID=2666183 RepID=UPI002949107D|nr:DUF5906 domain-containing protein [Pseudomonas juntendi]MDV5388474.1 DUF5906 domain-containing protein [Pseudomonas juntendi]